MGFWEAMIKSRSTDPDYIVSFGGKYWNGFKFVARKAEAITINGVEAAWNYVDSTFSEKTAEAVSLERLTKKKPVCP